MTARDSAIYDGIVQRPLSSETTSKHARGAATAGPQDPAGGRQRKSPASHCFSISPSQSDTDQPHNSQVLIAASHLHPVTLTSSLSLSLSPSQPHASYHFRRSFR